MYAKRNYFEQHYALLICMLPIECYLEWIPCFVFVVEVLKVQVLNPHQEYCSIGLLIALLPCAQVLGLSD